MVLFQAGKEKMSNPPDFAALQAELQTQNIQFLFAQFTDIHGSAKGKLIPVSHIADLHMPGAGFAGPSIWGTALGRSGPRSEYYGRADFSTLQAMPWLPGYARVVLDGYVGGEVFPLCSRQVLRQQSARLAQHGWQMNAGLEPEFFLLEKNGLPHSADSLAKPSYDAKSLLRQRNFIEQLVAGLNVCGFGVFQIDHEDAPGQYEINYHYAHALQAADRLMLFKIAAAELAEQQNLRFSMMPKPFADRPGSGLHFHLSLADAQGGNVLALRPDEADLYGLGLSAIGYHFLAGLLAHAPALCALCAPTVNSYKRLQCADSLSGTSWAPATIAWGDNNRTAVARVVYQRIEWRLPDASANPYLALAAVIAAGLDGIQRQLDPGPAIIDDLYEMALAQRKASQLAILPQNLGLACDALQQDTQLIEALGEELIAEFLRLKRAEWLQYNQQISPWELDAYLEKF